MKRKETRAEYLVKRLNDTKDDIRTLERQLYYVRATPRIFYNLKLLGRDIPSPQGLRESFELFLQERILKYQHAQEKYEEELDEIERKVKR